MEILDFDMAVGPGYGEGQYGLTVVLSPVGYVFGKFEFSPQLEQLVGKWKSPDRFRSSNEMSVEDVRREGAILFDALMNGRVREAFSDSRAYAQRQGKGLRVTLRMIAPELAALHWETLFDPEKGAFLSLSNETYLMRGLDVPQLLRANPFIPPIRILGVLSSPRDLPALDLKRERNDVEKALSKLSKDGLVEIEWLENPTLRDLQRALSPAKGPWHIFHYAGHSYYDSAQGDGFIALTDSEGKAMSVSAKKLGTLLANHSSLRLVYLGTDMGAVGGDDDSTSGLAMTIYRQGVPAVLSYQGHVFDKMALLFAQSFYESICDGLTIEAALAQARITLQLEDEWGASWLLPVLYCHSADAAQFRAETQVSDAPDERGKKGKPAAKKQEITKLSGEQYERFKNALVSAYDAEELKRMVRSCMDADLEAVAGGTDNLTTVVSDLVLWAERTGRLGALINGALRSNPTNPDLRQFAESLDLS